MKTTIISDSVLLITSGIQLSDLKNVQKYKKEALTLYEKDEDGVKEPVFSVYYDEGEDGAINDVGAVFGKANPDGFAQIVMLIKPPKDKDAKEFVADTIGGGLMKLAKFEEYIPGVIDALNAERVAILDSIEIAG